MLNCSVQVFPPSVDCQAGAFAPQLPENAEMAIWFVLFGSIAIEGSPSLAVSVLVRLALVLLTTTSRTKAVGKIADGCSNCGNAGRPPGAKSSGIGARAYGVRSGGPSFSIGGFRRWGRGGGGGGGSKKKGNKSQKKKEK